MNAIKNLFLKKNKNILSIFFTAGYPKIDSTEYILKKLQKTSVDIIEIGMPYSDPLADGPIIQKSSQKALNNGMTISKLFLQLENVKKEINTPLIIMGYYNQFLCFGEEKFLSLCVKSGVSGLILPDLPPDIYCSQYKKLFESYNLLPIFLITPRTSNERIKMLSQIKLGFLYLVSSNATTGIKENFDINHITFFERVKSLNIKIPKLIGFGISNKHTFDIACNYAEGGIIGSAFINNLDENHLNESLIKFLNKFKGKNS